jgi:hypothetical protein
VALAEFYTTNSNGSFLRILNNRHAQGADWTSANTRIQQRIDVTDQGYIEFNPIGAQYGVAIGTGTTEIMRFVQAGNVVINTTTTSTSTTTGALVIKGGAGIAGALYIVNTGDVSANIGTLFLGNASTQANLGAFEAYANTKIGTNTNSNLVAVATTTSTSTTTGALVVAGGVGIGGNLNTGSTSINASLVGGTTSQLQINGDVTIAGANRSVLGNMFYQGGWKYAANGAAWGFREDNTGNLQVIAAPVNGSGALAAASATYPITLNLTTGNLGIGTTMTSPNALLHVKDGTDAIYFEPTGNWAGKIFNATDAANEHGLVVGQRWAAAASTAFEVGSTYGSGSAWRSYFKIDGLGGMTMSSGGSERIIMSSSTGNLVINATTTSTSTTTGALVVKGGAGIAGNITTSGQLTLTNASDYNLYASGAGDNFMQGALGIGALPAASTVTLVGSNPATGATTVNNILLNSDIQSDVTSTYNSYNSNPSTAATAFTLTNLRHFSAQQRAFGAGSTVTNQVGFYALSSLTGATNNYGFQSAIASGTGRFNFYASGTANNYFAGNVGIGTTTPGFPLTVSGAASVSGNLSVGEASVSGNLSVVGSFFQGTLPSVLNDISSQFDSVASVFPLKLDQTSISSITNSADVEVVINGRRLVPYVTEQRFPWLTPYDSYRGYRVSNGNLIIYNAPDIGDQAMVTIVSTSAAVQTRRYPYSATTIAFGD